MTRRIPRTASGSWWSGSGRAELDSRPQVLEPTRSAARQGRVTLVYSSHDTEHNNAVALQDYLDSKIGKKRQHP